MKIRTRKYAALATLLTALDILSAGCRLTAMQVSGVTPSVFVPATAWLTLTPTDTSSMLPSPTIIPTPISTATSGTPLTTASISGPFRMVKAVDEIVSGKFEGLVSSTDGALWLISDQEVAKIVDSTITIYLKSIPGKIAGIDAFGRIWVVNEDASQISAWNGQAWTAYGVEAGWTALKGDYYQYVSGGQRDLLGRIWFATSQDVRVFDDDRWAVYTPQAMGMEASNQEDLETRYKVNVFRGGVVWVRECDWGGPGPMGGQGIRWLDEGVWRGASSPVASGCGIAVAEDSIGRIWAGVDSHLWRYDPASDNWYEFAAPDPPIADMRFGFIDSLAIDADNSAWPVLILCGGASCYGNSVLYHFHDEQWTQVGKVGEFDGSYWGPVFDAAGMAWLYWEGGIYRIKGDTPELASPLAGRSGTMDKRGRLWFVAPYEGSDTLWVLDDETGN